MARILTVVDVMMMKKAKHLAMLLGIEDFKDSLTWLQYGKKKHGLYRRNAHDESN